MRTSPLLLAIWACGFATCLQPIGTVRGDELKPVVISDEARAMIDAMIAARRDLKSGIYTATVRHTITKAHQTSVMQTAALRYVFDHSAACLRYENRGEIMIEIGRAEEDSADFVRRIKERTRVSKARMRPIMVYFARNADYSAGWHGIGDRKDDDVGVFQISLRPPEDRGFHGFSTVLHPSVAGMTDERDFRSVDDDIEVVLKRHASRVEKVSLKPLESGRVELHYDIESNLGGWRRTLEIDPANGFTCRRMTIALLKTLSDPEPAPFEVTADWAQRDGTWVPIRTTLRSLHLKESMTEYDFVLDWAEVNPKRINPQEFDYHTFEHVWPGTRVYDCRKATLQLIEVVDARDDSEEQ